MSISRKKSSDLTSKMMDGSTRMGTRVKSMQKSKTPVVASKRPTPPEAVVELYSEVSEGIRTNIRALMDAETQFEDPITLNQLGKMMGYSSAYIYGIMGGRNEIGIMTVCRMAHALGCDPWFLLMPSDEFKSKVIPNYIKSRRSGDAEISPKRSASKTASKR